MNSENIKQVTNQAIEQLVEDLNQGHSEALTRYLGAMARFRAYSFLNVLLILKQCPNAGRVAGYKTWQSFGRQVKKGEKGIMILAPIIANNQKRKSNLVKWKNLVMWLVSARFTSGMNSRPQATTCPRSTALRATQMSYLERLEEFVRKNGVELSYSDAIAPAKGRAEKGKITLLPSRVPLKHSRR